jgi:hypothetical protein
VVTLLEYKPEPDAVLQELGACPPPLYSELTTFVNEQLPIVGSAAGHQIHFRRFRPI